MSGPDAGHAAEFAALADELLAAGRAHELESQLGEPDLAELWDEPEVLGAVAEAFGRHAAVGRLLDVAVVRSGDTSVLLDVPGAGTPAVRTVGDVVEVDGVVRGRGADGVVVAMDREVRRVPLSALQVTTIEGFDPGAGLQRVSGEVARGTGEPLELDPDELDVRVARFLAHELVGVADGALALALDHVRGREQFGVAIGSFQAVRHRLAEAFVHTTAARELLAAIGPDGGVDVHLLVLKAAAGHAALTTVAAAQQVCGGMGFTEEFGLHRFVRRAYLLDSLMGGSEAAEALLGGLALDGQVLPDRQVVLS